MSHVHGIHHVTAIAGAARENLDFYTGVLGMRLVKRSVNQDDPGTYHLFYADAEGHPGTDLTFFPWPRLRPSRNGIGLTVEVALAVPPDTLDYWSARLDEHGVERGEPTERFGERVLQFTDPHGLELALVEATEAGAESPAGGEPPAAAQSDMAAASSRSGARGAREFTPRADSPVPEPRQIRGFHTVRLRERDLEETASFLSDGFGFAALGEEDGWHRFGAEDGGSGRMLEIRELPDERRGTWGTGGVHHVAWRVEDEAEQASVRERVVAAGLSPTPVIDRFWFKSVYFKEPGGVLFEIATDGPGFTVDEDAAELGERLILPPWLEEHRARIEQALPSLEEAGAGR